MNLSRIHPLFYHARIEQFRLQRTLQNLLISRKFARERAETSLPYTVKKHQSLLRRKLGDTDPQLQENKIVNLRIAIKQIDGILIKPGEILSFWQLVGRTTRRKGYVEGMLLSRGEVRTGIGGGICQLANLLYWMALHSPLQVIERHHHSFDPFPDHNRTLPFGSGASVFYNYVDLRFLNPTDLTFQFRVWMTDRHLKGGIYSDRLTDYTYHVKETDHRFLEIDGKTCRENKLWRTVIDRRTGRQVGLEFIMHNFAEVKYRLDPAVLQTAADHNYGPDDARS